MSEAIDRQREGATDDTSSEGETAGITADLDGIETELTSSSSTPPSFSLPSKWRNKTKRGRTTGSDEGVPSRGIGSYTLTFLQFLSAGAFLGGGITMLVLSAGKADETPSIGELPMIWAVSAKVIYFKSVSPGYFLGAGMIVAGLMLMFDTLMLFHGCRKVFFYNYKEIQRDVNTKMDGRQIKKNFEANERRYDPGRTRRIRMRMVLTQWTLLLSLLMVCGVVDLIQQVSSVVMCAASLLLLFAANSAAGILKLTRDSGRDPQGKDGALYKKRVENASASIPILTSMSLLLVMTPFMAMWVNYHHAKDHSGFPVSETMLAPLVMFSIGFFLYWLLSSAKANKDIDIKHVPWFLRPIAMFSRLFSSCGSIVMDAGIREEFFIMLLDLSNFGISSWLIYDTVISKWPTDLTP